MPRVSIIVLNRNGIDYLPECLDSLKNQTYKNFEVVLVDNGSTDGSACFVRSEYPWVRLVELTENKGFSGGNNAALSCATGEFIVTLNNDTRAESGWLEELVRVTDLFPHAGMVGCRTCVYGDEDLVDTLGGLVCIDGMARTAYRLKRFSELDLPEVVEGFYPSAAAALYKRSMIDDIGFFDDDFFAYSEDTDLGLRARWYGYGCVIATRAIVHHHYSATGGVFSPFKVYQVERNHFWTACKNLPVSLLILLPFTTLYRYAIQTLLVLRGTGAGSEFRENPSVLALVTAVVRGVLDALTGMPRMVKKRVTLMKHARIPSSEMTNLLIQYRLGFSELLK